MKLVLAFLAGIAAYHVALVSLHKFTYTQSGVGPDVEAHVDEIMRRYGGALNALADYDGEEPLFV